MAVTSKFRKAARQKLKASIMIEGLQGSGKSGLALLLAKALTDDWDKIYAIDTENQSLDFCVPLRCASGRYVRTSLTLIPTLRFGTASQVLPALT